VAKIADHSVRHIGLDDGVRIVVNVASCQERYQLGLDYCNIVAKTVSCPSRDDQ
jgi:hypothetical protein